MTVAPDNGLFAAAELVGASDVIPEAVVGFFALVELQDEAAGGQDGDGCLIAGVVVALTLPSRCFCASRFFRKSRRQKIAKMLRTINRACFVDAWSSLNDGDWRGSVCGCMVVFAPVNSLQCQCRGELRQKESAKLHDGACGAA